jgi:signal transduction histidine kinase
MDVADVLDTSLEAVNSTCAVKKISLTKELVPRPWPVLGDASRLRQSFDNLLRNALEAQPNGGEIFVSVQKNDQELIVDISDGGPGVPAERRDELFEFGKTTKAGGSGIGLPLSQLIVESHGGSLVYQDRNGNRRGATFRITLPLEASH